MASTAADALNALRGTAETVQCYDCAGEYHPAEIPDLPGMAIDVTGSTIGIVCYDCAIQIIRGYRDLSDAIADEGFLDRINAEWRRAMPIRRRRINAAFKSAGIPVKLLKARKR